MLNHTDTLKLDKTSITNQWLQQWYGIKMPDQQGYVKLDSEWIAQIGQRVYFNQKELPNESSEMIGAYKNDRYIIIGFKKLIMLLTHDGGLIEKINHEAGLPFPIMKMGINKNKDKVMFMVDQNFYSSDDEFLSWKKVQAKHYTLLTLTQPSKIEIGAFRKRYLGNDLNLERVLLDIHSGRLFSWIGVLIYDITALFMIILSFTGFWMWHCRFKKRRLKDKL